jgi:Zn finger protein HypA/HybF involved in hydrogenase expression
MAEGKLVRLEVNEIGQGEISVDGREVDLVRGVKVNIGAGERTRVSIEYSLAKVYAEVTAAIEESQHGEVIVYSCECEHCGRLDLAASKCEVAVRNLRCTECGGPRTAFPLKPVTGPSSDKLVNPILWIVGATAKQSEGCAVVERWEFIGVFTTKEKATAACKDEFYFIAPMAMNRPAPHESNVPWPGCYYPLLEKGPRA